jgi:hypothetical protein
LQQKLIDLPVSQVAKPPLEADEHSERPKWLGGRGVRWRVYCEGASLVITAILVVTTFWYALETFRLREQIERQTSQAAEQNKMMRESIDQQTKQTSEMMAQRKLLEQQLSIANSEHWNSVSPLLYPEFATAEDVIRYETTAKNLTPAQLKPLQGGKYREVMPLLLQTYRTYWIRVFNRVSRLARDVSVVVHDPGMASFWVADRHLPILDNDHPFDVPPTGNWMEKADVIQQKVTFYGAQ